MILTHRSLVQACLVYYLLWDIEVCAIVYYTPTHMQAGVFGANWCMHAHTYVTRSIEIRCFCMGCVWNRDAAKNSCGSIFLKIFWNFCRIVIPNLSWNMLWTFQIKTQLINVVIMKISEWKVPFIILRHCCTHWLCWLRTWGGASSLTKTLISQSALCTFASVFMLVTLALCVKCWRTLKETWMSYSRIS